MPTPPNSSSDLNHSSHPGPPGTMLYTQDTADPLIPEMFLEKEADYEEWFAGKVRATQERLSNGSTTTKEHDAVMHSVWERVLLNIGPCGKAQAKLVPLVAPTNLKRRLGSMTGRLQVADDFDAPLPEVLASFEGQPVCNPPYPDPSNPNS